MEPAAVGLGRVLDGVRFTAPALRVFTSVEGRALTGSDDLAALLVRQVTAPVRWEETVAAMLRLEPTVALEVGPGKALTGLLRRMAPGVTGVPVGDVAGVRRAAELLA
jgi:[acyl-carrier-protein] S-malonyltransferase